jgi:hypothetical protein
LTQDLFVQADKETELFLPGTISWLGKRQTCSFQISFLNTGNPIAEKLIDEKFGIQGDQCWIAKFQMTEVSHAD